MEKRDGGTLGALPNILDKEPDAGGNQPAIASIDLGTAGTAGGGLVGLAAWYCYLRKKG